MWADVVGVGMDMLNSDAWSPAYTIPAVLLQIRMAMYVLFPLSPLSLLLLPFSSSFFRPSFVVVRRERGKADTLRKMKSSNLEPRPARLDPQNWKTPYSISEAIEGFSRVAVRSSFLLPFLSVSFLSIRFDSTWIDEVGVEADAMMFDRLNTVGRSMSLLRNYERAVDFDLPPPSPFPSLLSFSSLSKHDAGGGKEEGGSIQQAIAFSTVQFYKNCISFFFVAISISVSV